MFHVKLILKKNSNWKNNKQAEIGEGMVAHGLSFSEPVEIYLDGPLGSRIDGIILPPNEEDKKNEVYTIACFPTRIGKYLLHVNINTPLVPVSNSPFTFGMNFIFILHY